MAKKKKKKATPHQLQKIAEAQLKKNFLKKVKFVFEAIGHAKLFPLIPKIDLDDLFEYRMKTFRVVKGNESSNIPNLLLTVIGKILKSNLTETNVQIMGDGPQLSISELDAVGTAINLVYGDEEYPRINKGIDFNIQLEPFINWYSNGTILTRNYFDEAGVLGSTLSNLEIGVIWIDTKFLNSVSIGGPRFNFKLNFKRTAIRKIKLEDSTRSVYQVAWAQNLSEGYEPAMFSLKESDLKREGISNPVEVYIQKHALTRIDDRLGNEIRGLTHKDIFYTFKENSPYYYENGKYYFDFLLFGKYKLGYLVGNIVEDILVIRTFLFLTNNGTPEGKKLRELTGFCKVDKKYLGIDKLSTFQNTDIKDNPTVKDLFIQAGCAPLFDLDINITPSTDKSLKMASKILSYLDTDQDEISTIEELEAAMEKEKL